MLCFHLGSIRPFKLLLRMRSEAYGVTHCSLSNELSDPNARKPYCCAHFWSNGPAQRRANTSAYDKGADPAI